MNTEINYIELGNRVRKAREHRKMTQDSLAELCELSTSHIGHIERGSRKLSVETLFKLSKSLNVSIDYLMLDSIDIDENILSNVTALLKTKDNSRKSRFLNIIKILTENIDTL